MTIIKSLVSAFLMYSRIPMPQIEWKEENRRYALCFFPLIGAVTGLLLLLWYYICGVYGIGDIIRGAVSVLIPIAVTGGIHIDGFCDTSDAIASYADSKRRLEIMSDPHIGSFAVIRLFIMLLIQFSLFCEIKGFEETAIIAAGYILSRAMSGIAAVTLRSAKKESALQSFVKPAHKKITLSVLTITAVICAAAVILILPFSGAAVCIMSAALFIFYRSFAYRNFGGITGDTEGYFLQMTETLLLAAVFIGEKISEVFPL